MQQGQEATIHEVDHKVTEGQTLVAGIPLKKALEDWVLWAVFCWLPFC